MKNINSSLLEACLHVKRECEKRRSTRISERNTIPIRIKKIRTEYPENVLQILKEWYGKRKINYPTQEQRKEILDEIYAKAHFSMSYYQLKTWFTNTRQRKPLNKM